jgi:RNA polymerase-binding protein DksA
MSLTDEQIAGLRDQMRARSRVLEAEIATKLRESTEDFEELGRTGDQADIAWAETESGLDLAEAQRDIEEWRGLRDALRRIDEGRYGVCLDCGTEVPIERLHLQPLAIRCVNCQARREKISQQYRAMA